MALADIVTGIVARRPAAVKKARLAGSLNVNAWVVVAVGAGFESRRTRPRWGHELIGERGVPTGTGPTVCARLIRWAARGSLAR